MMCPVCAHDTAPAAVAGPVAICGACGFTCHIDETGTVTRATMKQIDALTHDQMTALRRAKQPLRDRR